MQPDRLILQPSRGKCTGPPQFEGRLGERRVYLVHRKRIIVQPACADTLINRLPLLFIRRNFHIVHRSLQKIRRIMDPECLRKDSIRLLLPLRHLIVKIGRPHSSSQSGRLPDSHTEDIGKLRQHADGLLRFPCHALPRYLPGSGIPEMLLRIIHRIPEAGRRGPFRQFLMELLSGSADRACETGRLLQQYHGFFCFLQRFDQERGTAQQLVCFRHGGAQKPRQAVQRIIPARLAAFHLQSHAVRVQGRHAGNHKRHHLGGQTGRHHTAVLILQIPVFLPFSVRVVLKEMVLPDPLFRLNVPFPAGKDAFFRLTVAVAVLLKQKRFPAFWIDGQIRLHQIQVIGPVVAPVALPVPGPVLTPGQIHDAGENTLPVRPLFHPFCQNFIQLSRCKLFCKKVLKRICRGRLHPFQNRHLSLRHRIGDFFDSQRIVSI